MTLLFSVLIIITCILLVVIVLVQNPKGGGLSSTLGGGGTQIFGGVKKTTDFLDRGTWTLAIVLVVLVLAANVVLAPQEGVREAESEIIDELGGAAPTPAAPQLNMPQTGQGNSDLPQPVEEEGNE